MKDYYAALGVGFGASQDILRTRLAAYPEGREKENMVHVLLDPARRRIYDKNWLTMNVVGTLRANLRMGNTEHWRDAESGNFGIAGDKHPLLHAQIEDVVRKHGSKKKVKAFLATCWGVLSWITFLGVCIFLFFSIRGYDAKPRVPIKLDVPRKAAPAVGPVTPFPVATKPALPLPETGVLSGEKGRAPLRIQAATDGNYYIKLCRNDGLPVLTGFIRGGETLETAAPLGRFELKCAVGEKWYGLKEFFGPETSYSKASEQFVFSMEGDDYNGYAVELERQIGGNLHIVGISPQDF